MITLVYGDYWVNIYRDGKKILEGHNPRAREVLDALGIRYEEVDMSAEDDQFDFDADTLEEGYKRQ